MPHRPVGSVWIAREGTRFTQVRPGHRVRVEENIEGGYNRVFNLTTNRLIVGGHYMMTDAQFSREEEAEAAVPPPAVPVFQPDPEERYFLMYGNSTANLNGPFTCYLGQAMTQQEAERQITTGTFGALDVYMVPARAVKRWANRAWDEEYGRIAPPRG